VLSWSQARRAVRIDHPGGNWMVADLNGRRGFMVSDPQRQMMNLPPPPTEGGLPGLIPPGGRFVRGETERVANTECTVWRVEMPDNSQGRTCITTDGVVLRSVGSAGPGQPEQGLEAVSVSYAPQAASRFSPPNGYRTVQPPPQQGGAPGGPPAGPPPGNPPRR
jgi:hypothetical protein